jgi:hypothetical protein
VLSAPKQNSAPAKYFRQMIHEEFLEQGILVMKNRLKLM